MNEPTPEEKEWDKVLRQMWLTTSLERDKAVITLSSAGLALLVSFFTRSTIHNLCSRMVLLTGLVGFTISILAGVWCLHLNRTIIVHELNREPEPKTSYHDRFLIYGFVAGVLSLSITGIINIITP